MKTVALLRPQQLVYFFFIGQRRKQPTLSELQALGNDGEALFTAIMGALDPSEAEADLSDSQRDAIRHFKETTLRSAITEATPERKVKFFACYTGFTRIDYF